MGSLAACPLMGQRRVHTPIKAKAHVPIKRAGYISATSAFQARTHLRSAAGRYSWAKSGPCPKSRSRHKGSLEDSRTARRACRRRVGPWSSLLSSRLDVRRTMISIGGLAALAKRASWRPFFQAVSIFIGALIKILIWRSSGRSERIRPGQLCNLTFADDLVH